MKRFDRSSTYALFHREVDELVRSVSAHTFQLVRGFLHGFLHAIFSGAEVWFESHMALLPESHTSHPISKLLRPVFQHNRIRTLFGANLAGALILVGTVSATPGVVETYPEAELSVLSEDKVVVTTESRFQLPVATIGLSQGFHGYHRGVDLRAPLGSKIVSTAKGRVVEVVYGRFGYGKYVLVEHENGFSSLYAHMGRISVSLGEEVEQDTQLGTVGLTGWSTGSHLHLEIYEDGLAINPLAVIPFL